MSTIGVIRGIAAAVRGSSLLRRLRDDQGGFSLVEVIVAAAMMIVVLSASLLTFELMLANQSTANSRIDSQDRVRTALDRLARDLRNTSGAATGTPEIDQATAYDLVYRTVNPQGPAQAQNPSNIERVRYCIDNTNPAAEVLWVQVQAMTGPNSPSFSAPQAGVCPDTSWSTQNTRYSDAITNQNGGQTRPVFSFSSSNGAITFVHTDLYVNANPVGAVTETHLSSGVFLRNQDVPPTAAFTATPGTGYATLDGSASTDPQGSPLTYQWYDTVSCNGQPAATVHIGQGIVLNYTKDPCTGNAPVKSGAHSITLKVFDPAQLEGDAGPTTVNVG